MRGKKISGVCEVCRVLLAVNPLMAFYFVGVTFIWVL